MSSASRADFVRAIVLSLEPKFETNLSQSSLKEFLRATCSLIQCILVLKSYIFLTYTCTTFYTTRPQRGVFTMSMLRSRSKITRTESESRTLPFMHGWLNPLIRCCRVEYIISFADFRMQTNKQTKKAKDVFYVPRV